VGWEPELEELARRTELARRMGGAEKVDRHREQGKLTVRERIDALLDAGTFHEVGALTGRATYDDHGNLVDVTPANFVMGRGRVEGRPIVVGGDDFTVRGGAADASIFQKQVHAERMARDLRMPIVRLVDGSGGGGSVKSLETERRSFVPFNPGWEHVVANLATVPVVSCCLGSVAGLGAARVVTSHYSVMVTGTSQLFVAGPPVVARLGEDVDKETLGGSAIHTRNGAVDDEVATEPEAFARVRRFLGYLPSSVDELPPRAPIADDDPRRRDESLLRAIPRDRRKVYKIRAIIEAVVDRDSWFELGTFNGRSAVTGLARLDGRPVAVLANDPYFYAGGWTATASEKVTRFVDLADSFHLPVVHLVDNPGFVIGTEAE
jgi:acetyl-CoA carboxylase carboxyltransferase component